MRHAHIALAATIAGLMVSATPSNAAPGATLTSPAADDGLVQKVQIFPRRYYRQYPCDTIADLRNGLPKGCCRTGRG